MTAAMDWPSGVPGESRWADRIMGRLSITVIFCVILILLPGGWRRRRRQPMTGVHQAALACHFPPAPPPPMFRAALITSQRRDVSQGSRSRPYAGGEVEHGRSRARGERPFKQQEEAEPAPPRRNAKKVYEYSTAISQCHHHRTIQQVRLTSVTYWLLIYYLMP